MLVVSCPGICPGQVIYQSIVFGGIAEQAYLRVGLLGGNIPIY